MRRRDLLGLVAAGTAGLAGCTGSGPGGRPTDSPTPSETPTATDSPSASPTRTTTPEPVALAVTDRQFEVLGVECGTAAESATVSHESTGERTGRVTVEGVVAGNDTCHSARLVSATATDDSLDVAVESYVPPENEGRACAECIVDVSYRAVVSYEGPGPFDVVVEHGGEQVAQSGPYPGDGGDSGGSDE
ncbi:hypothetical protein N0B31_05335 [Salinirubellus salinus]|jgi:hypothetical protein|uniref:Lipoprotein n=1 Tax=Salinirubellus salinus TaxID=1364945 RepID=A0A9E7R5G8_9EURY|nr:hypothetical protein [Salinirubellus salinus]UWM55708.1 hypothetical protein N0B31_05335 [Salinirubellus salinus]